MEVYGALKHDMDRFIKKCAHLFQERGSEDYLSLLLCTQFFKQRVIIAFQCALAFAIGKKIVLIGDACSRPPITIRSHDLHLSDIRGH
jgi:hypothetical protein